jgi:hypothetical protein
MDFATLQARVHRLIDRVGSRTISEKTLKEYRPIFVRMWRSGDLDPLHGSVSRDSYQKRKAALYFVALLWVGRLYARLIASAGNGDKRTAWRWGRILIRALNQVEKIVILDPPLHSDVSPLGLPRSRYHELPNRPKRGAGSKKHLLSQLPRDWQDRVWNLAKDDFRAPRTITILSLT